MAHSNEGVMGSIEVVQLGFFSPEEVPKQSFVNITNPSLLDSIDRPIPGGLYDPALGPLEERTPCKSCGQSSFNCPDHCGHIELVSLVYNPLLFNTLCSLLRKTCLFCRHFLAGSYEVEMCGSKLELIAEGDVVGARNLVEPRDLDNGSSNESSNEKDYAHGSKHLKQQKWTSLQITEVMSILKNLPRLGRFDKCCKNCEEVLAKDPCTLQLKIEKDVRTNGEAALASLDQKMISRLNDITSKSEELEGLLSEGLLKPHIKNCTSLMTTSGAKGGGVNFQQISSHLGQQELEGKRVPRMVSGKTLPCFPHGIGHLVLKLVGTAIKASRSGYLQRCLVKNLESLKVSYDHTVRDADGSIVQFLYGEDGVDVHQSSFLSNLEALAINEEMITKKCCRQVDKSCPYIQDLPSALKKKAWNFVNKLSSEKNCDGSHQGKFWSTNISQVLLNQENRLVFLPLSP